MSGAAVKNYEEMSDEEFMNMSSPLPVSDEPPAQEPVVQAPASEPEVEPQSQAAGDQAVEDENNEPAGAAEGEVVAGTESADQQAAGNDAKAEADKPADEKPVEEKPAEPAAAPVDYEAFYKQVMTPFKANGRTFEIRSPDEVIRLMQMGAGFGRKIQDLQPYMKTIRMLEKNDLLDEGKLSYLIDIHQKNPDAIKKVIKDSGIDPLDVNINEATNYIPKNHSVSDREVEFQEVIKEVRLASTGSETINLVNQTWDQESKAVLWENPQVLQIIQSHRENGIYDRITAEIDRQKALGYIAPNTPFLKAYKTVGDSFVAAQGQGVTQQPIQNQQVVEPQPQVIAVRPDAPKAQIRNGDKAAAASLTKSVSTDKAKSTVNPLQMADDDFMKQFNGRF